MRLFIALDLNLKNKEALSLLQSDLKKATGDIKWVKPGNIHLTLKFLGEVREEKIPQITQALKESASRIKPFAIEIKNPGVFPNWRAPRILWVSVENGKDKLRDLSAYLGRALIQLKFPPERREFSPHITLGRIKSGLNKDILVKRIKEINFTSMHQEISSIVLYKSALSCGGPVYEKLSEESFNKS